MKRSVCAMMTAAAVAGCQGSAKHAAKPVAVAPATSGKPVAAMPAPAGDVVPVNYNAGHGRMSNNNFRGQKIAAALPSHGGMGMGGPPGMGPMGPGGMGGPGGMPPGMMGGPGGMPPGIMGGGMGGPPGMGPMGPGGYAGQPLGPRFTTGRTQIRFAAPLSMKVVWQTSEDGVNVRFGDQALVVPDRYNFAQGAIYRLKLSDIQKREGAELYPTLEVYPGSAKTDAYLAHNAVPLEFTEEDFDQVAGGNMVTKVIYLPDAKYQELAIAGVETLVSTRLDPGVDPVKEAHRRGSILAVIRMGSVDLEPAHSPPLLPTGPAAGMMPPGMGMMPPGMAPPGMMPPGMQRGMMPPGMVPPGAQQGMAKQPTPQAPVGNPMMGRNAPAPLPTNTRAPATRLPAPAASPRASAMPIPTLQEVAAPVAPPAPILENPSIPVPVR